MDNQIVNTPPASQTAALKGFCVTGKTSTGVAGSVANFNTNATCPNAGTCKSKKCAIAALNNITTPPVIQVPTPFEG